MVTPIYNTAEYLAECIESVLRQTYQNWEYILVDNCSTDGSDRIAEEYVARDRRLRLIRNKQFLSQVQNFNSALRYISPHGRYCKIVQSDDWIFPECIERMVERAESDAGVGMVGSYFLAGKRLQAGGLPYSVSVISGRDLCRLHLLTPLYVFGSPSALLYRADVVRSANSFYDEHSIAIDLDVCYRVLEKWNFGFVHQVLSFYRTDNQSISSAIRRFDPEYLRDKLIMLGKYGPVYLGPEETAQKFHDAERPYLKYLCALVLHRSAKGLWEYHRKGLATIGYDLRWWKLAKWILLEALNALGNPKDTLERAGRLLWRTVHGSAGKPAGEAPLTADQASVLPRNPIQNGVAGGRHKPASSGPV